MRRCTDVSRRGALWQRRRVVTFNPQHSTQTHPWGSKWERLSFEESRRREGGEDYYRRQTPLFGTTVQLEKAMTDAAFSPGERMPPTMLPAPVAAAQVEGAAVALLEPSAADALETVSTSEAMPHSLAAAAEEALAEREQVLTDELTRCTPSHETWDSLGLDPTVASLCRRVYGEHPTTVQARLLQALINEAHNDVIFNGVTGAGKTAALVIAALHGVRTEAAGLNLVVCRTRDVAYAAFCLAKQLLGGVGGALVDAETGDLSWLIIAEGKEQFRDHYRNLMQLRKTSAVGPRLLFTTADVMCEMMFRKYLEFAPFGMLRRCYFDDAGQQFQVARPGVHSVEQAKHIQDNPTAADMLAATLHQLPGPDVRSLLQIAAVSADLDTVMKDHIKSLCVKPAAHAVILSPTRLPTTVHCLFSFFTLRSLGSTPSGYGSRGGDAESSPEAYLVQLLRNANATIPGRAAIFVRKEACLLTARAAFRSLGMDAKILGEVSQPGGAFREQGWKFLLLHEHEAYGLDIPRLSHVFITFPPADRHAYLHMAGRVGRMGAPGWVYVVTDQREAPLVAKTVDELDVPVVGYTITHDLRSVPAEEVERWTKQVPSIHDPQELVAHHYVSLESQPVRDTDRREFFDQPLRNQFWREREQDVEREDRRYKAAMKLRAQMQKDPRIIEELLKDGMLHPTTLQPTRAMRAHLADRRPAANETHARRSAPMPIVDLWSDDANP